MSAGLGFLELLLLAALFFAVVGVALATVAWRGLRTRVERWHPRLGGWISFALATAPAWLPVAGLALCLAANQIGTDHCVHHPEHPHLCMRHPGVGLANAGLGALPAALAGIVLAGLLARGCLGLARARRALAAIEGFEETPGDAAWRVLETERPLSLTVGLLRPRILLSRGLVRALAPTGLDCVLAHEREHRRRRDPLRATLARAASWPLPRSTRDGVLRALRVASERCCDEAAAQAVGDRLLVAETILRVERLLRPEAPLAAVSAFGASDVPARVEALLREPGRAPGRGATLLFGVAALALGIACAEPLHHEVEHLLRAALSLP